MTLRETINQKRQDILNTAAMYGAYNVRLFGSAARGEDDASSDIDFLVDIESGRTLLDHAALVVALEDLLGRKVDVATERNLKDRIKPRVIQEAILL
ncbi:MAG: nucleotidyltransferase family protein [Armatimonadota bacterium]